MVPITAAEPELITDPESETEYFHQPLGRTWERDATAALVEMTHLLTTGHYQTHMDFVMHLYQIANQQIQKRSTAINPA